MYKQCIFNSEDIKQLTLYTYIHRIKYTRNIPNDEIKIQK